MKLSLFLILLGLLPIQAKVFSQNAAISLNIENEPMRDALRQVERESGLRFFMSDDLPVMNELVSIHVRNESFAQVMTKLLGKYDLDYRVLENKMVVITERKFLQQGIAISGTVTDDKGVPLPGASIAVQGTLTGAVADANGHFTITVPDDNAVLIISFVGYTSQEITVGSQRDITVALSEGQQIEEVVVVGYGVQKKASLTGSVATIKGDELEQVPASNLTNALAGKLSGVSISQSEGGRPGNSSNLIIRARGTWNSTAPLYVIDGVVRDAQAFNALDASQVESISILKDASAASIYGSRAANGVVLVQTKRGKTGKAQVNYAGSVGMGNFTLVPDR